VSASLYVSIALVCAAWFGGGIMVGFSLCVWRIRRATRKIDAVRANSQLDVTGIHHVPPAAHPTPHDRPRAKKDEDGQR
jgi:hypothetical protein